MTAEEFLEEFQNSEIIGAQTSGSTGIPKRIELEREFMRESARRTNAFFGIDSSSRIHSCIAFDYIGGKMTLVRALEAGCTLTAEAPSNQPTLRGEIIASGCKPETTDAELQKISVVSVVPSQMPWLLERRGVLTAVENYLIGGSSLPAQIRREIAESGVPAWESYGMTETSSHIAIRRVEADDTLPFHTLGDITVAADQRDCLVIKIPTGKEEVRRIVTNDIAELQSEREFRIIGRYDDVIISGGKKFHPAEAERRLGRLTEVPLLFVAREDSKWGEAIELLAERMIGKGDAEIEHEIWEAIDRILEHWQRPKRLRIVDRLPHTANGKPRRR